MAAPEWTTDRVLALAPDQSSVAAARSLSRSPTWSGLGTTGFLVFGRCQGSGKVPYQVAVDLAGPSFTCNCPSRKIPCKHALALLLLWVRNADRVGEVAEPADFAREWAARRQAGESRRAARPPGGTAEVADPVARARRRAEREAAMTAGLEEFEQWLGDLARQGLAGTRRQPYAFWDAMAARLVDTQLPALAERVREVGGSLSAREDWADVLLAECGRWALAARAWRRRADLPVALAADLRVFLGWSWRADEVAEFERVHDAWVVAGVREGNDGRIASQRTWLWGRGTGRWVVLLDFAATSASLRVPQVAGTVVDDTLAVYPGSEPSRAALSGSGTVTAEPALPPALPLAEATDQLASWLAANPWRDRLPVSLDSVVAARSGDGRWWLRDQAGDRLPLAAAAEPWLLLALSDGVPAVVTAEWDRDALFPMAVAAAGVPAPL